MSYHPHFHPHHPHQQPPGHPGAPPYPPVPYAAAPPSGYPPAAPQNPMPALPMMPPPQQQQQQQPYPPAAPFPHSQPMQLPPPGPHGYPSGPPAQVNNYANPPPYNAYAQQCAPQLPLPPQQQQQQQPYLQQPQYPPTTAAPPPASYYTNMSPFSPSTAMLPLQQHQQQQQQHMYPPHHQPNPYSFPPYSPTAPITAHQHPATLGVQLDMYGLPVVPGDPPISYSQKFRVEEKVMTRDSFSIHDQNGTIRYKVDGSFSINERKTIKDINNNVLLKLKEARMKMRDKITVSNVHNVPVLTLQKASAIQIGSKRVNGYLGGTVGGFPSLIITGNHNNTRFHVMNSKNLEMADIYRRKYSVKNMLTDQDTYDVTVHCGSAALMCFITVAIDEIYED